MAKKTDKVVEANSKWGKLAGGCLVGEQIVTLHIPKDKMNPGVNHVWVGLNGDEAYLAIGKQIEVPESIANLWEHSYQGTLEAEEKITANTEIYA